MNDNRKKVSPGRNIRYCSTVVFSPYFSPYSHRIPILYGRNSPTRITAKYGTNTTVLVPYVSTWVPNTSASAFLKLFLLRSGMGKTSSSKVRLELWTFSESVWYKFVKAFYNEEKRHWFDFHKELEWWESMYLWNHSFSTYLDHFISLRDVTKFRMSDRADNGR